MEKLFEIIHEDVGILVVNKPAGLVCHPTKNGEMSSLIGRMRLHLNSQKSAFDNQPSPTSQPHLINRLDRETSGVVVAAKNSETAGALGKIWETRNVQKEYLAIVHGEVREKSGLIDAPLGKDLSSKVAIKDCVRPDGAAAQTEFEVLKTFSRDNRPFALLRVLPRTGRKHQIRIHLAHIGHPIVGDKIYGHDEDCYLALVENRLSDEQKRKLILPNHALHARSIQFIQRGETFHFSCEPEDWFAKFAG